jgi:hypothetical protein
MFRELEVELAENTPPSIVDALVDQLRLAGANAPDPTPKYIRSLGPHVALPAEIPIRAALSRESTCGDVVQRALATAVR